MHCPNSTYRLQFNHTFGFNAARKIVPYIAELGISDIYASPILKSAKGSMHGYDVVDPGQLNPELGLPEDYELLIEEYKKHNLKWLQDIVPNHMSYSSENQMIVDLLENGPDSRFYDFFDIEWNHPHASARQRVLAPFLGRFYQEVLESGELKLAYDAEGFSLNYYENRFPLSMESYADILSFRLAALRNKLGKNAPDMLKYLAVIYVIRSLPSADELDERYSQIKFVKSMLWEIYNQNEDIKVFLEESIRIYNGRTDSAESYNLLDNLHAAQHFRLAFWKVANEEINYRRFFNINGLISLKMENEDAFNRVHQYVLNLVRDGNIDGLRIDHVDGLFDPTSYLKRLRSRTENNYLVVEKILEAEEDLPDIWPVEGTTGYDFTNFLNMIFIKQDNERRFTNIYQDFTRVLTPPERIIWEKKRLIIQTRMAGEVERLAFIVESVSSKDRYGIDLTMHGIKRALEEILTYFPVYRTYINGEFFIERDHKYLEMVFQKVREENPRLQNEFSFICNLLMMKYGENFNDEQKKNVLNFIMKFQQLTGPLMAKGFEDTALYVYNRLISLNEVGGNPAKFGISLEEFAQFNNKRVESWPHTLNATSTHDTKRGEDTRARINVLSELPDEWENKIRSWSELNNPVKQVVKGFNVPDKNDEYFLYQTLIGSFPFSEQSDEVYINRIKEYIIKAVREAKVHTAWIKPDEAYESGFQAFIEKILSPSEDNSFLKDFSEFHRKVAHFGIFNSLSQTLIKITSPGVPDFYQGCELWDLSLVDPDNRRPVDYNIRRHYLKEIMEYESGGSTLKYIKKLFNDMSDGRVKLFLIYRALRARNQNAQLFQEGIFMPIGAGGKYADNIIAFARKSEDGTCCVTVVPRFLSRVIKEDQTPIGPKIWEDTYVDLSSFNSDSWKETLTGETIKHDKMLSVGSLFRYFPAAMLIAKENTKTAKENSKTAKENSKIA